MLFKKLMISGLLAFAAAGSAQAAGVTLVAKVLQERVVDVDGKKVVRLVPATRVTPGDAVIYQISYTNGGTKVAEDVVLTNPIPSGLEYVAGEGASLSIDGAKNFGALTSLRVPLAAGGSRPATAKDITHLRWSLAAIKPGATGNVNFRARLK